MISRMKLRPRSDCCTPRFLTAQLLDLDQIAASVVHLFYFPMVFPADGASLVGRVYRNVDHLVTPQPAAVSLERGLP